MRIATADLSVSADGGRPEAVSVDHRLSSDTYGLDNETTKSPRISCMPSDGDKMAPMQALNYQSQTDPSGPYLARADQVSVLISRG